MVKKGKPSKPLPRRGGVLKRILKLLCFCSASAKDAIALLDSCCYDEGDCSWSSTTTLDSGWDWALLRCEEDDDNARGGGGNHGGAVSFFPAMPMCQESSSSSGGGGGYLEDAVAHWSDRCKRQRMSTAAEAPLSPPRCPVLTAGEELQCLLQSFWDRPSSSSGGEAGSLLHDSNIMVPPDPETSNFASGEEEDASGKEKEQVQVQGVPFSQASAAGRGDAAGGPPPPPPAFSGTEERVRTLRLQKATTGGSHYCYNSTSSSGSEPSSSTCSKLAAGKKDGGGGDVLYPFAVVKPLGLEGGATTLKDVNRRILKRPARPVRHPVGAFSCGPAVSPHGLGMSGKAVVSLTRIRTGGKGTITIIRTRG